MTEGIIIRPHKAEDIPALTVIWQDAFGDEKHLIGTFYSLLPEMGKGFVAEKEGKVIGMLHLLDAVFEDKRIGYVYAVAVKLEERRRGIGRALCEAALEMDYDIIATLPAEKDLYAWYEKVLGTKPALYGKHEKLLPGEGKAYYEVDAKEYGHIRERLLRGKAHIDFPVNYLRFQEAICRSYGGGMYAGAGGLACGYVEDRMLYVKEALGDVSFLSAVCSSLGANYAVIRRADPCGELFIAAQVDFPAECEWNIALD